MEYLKKYKLKLSSKYDNVLGKHPKKTFESFITEENKHLATP
jgi:casein kinase II subunit alpha